MFKLPKNFFDAENELCGLPADWCEKGQKNEYYLFEIGYGTMEMVTLKGAVYYICEMIEKYKEEEFRYLPIGLQKYICDEGFCEPTGTEALWFQTEEEFYDWVKKTFQIGG